MKRRPNPDAPGVFSILLYVRRPARTSFNEGRGFHEPCAKPSRSVCSICMGCSSGREPSAPGPVANVSYPLSIELFVNSTPATVDNDSDGAHAALTSVRNWLEKLPRLTRSIHGFAGAQPTGRGSPGDWQGATRLNKLMKPRGDW